MMQSQYRYCHTFRMSVSRLIVSSSVVLCSIFFISIVLSSVVFSPVAAADQQDKTVDERSALLATLATAKTELEGRIAEDAVWRYWFDQAPTPEVRALLDAAIERREAYDFEAAENILDDVVSLAPDYSEGFNQRGFIRFLRENFADAEIDVNRALELEPSHFGAHAGKYHIYSRMGQLDKAFDALRIAVSIYPWIQERSVLPESLWPQNYRDIHKPGQDI